MNIFTDNVPLTIHVLGLMKFYGTPLMPGIEFNIIYSCLPVKTISVRPLLYVYVFLYDMCLLTRKRLYMYLAIVKTEQEKIKAHTEIL